MRRMTQFLMALPVIAGMSLAALPAAQAQPGRWGGPGWGRGGPGWGGPRHHGEGGAIAGALIGGLAVGALAGAAMNSGPGGYYGYGYAPPPPPPPPPPPRAYMVPVAPAVPVGPPGYYYAAPGGYYSGW
ncbi:hypothetical protein [Acetobacter ghanensis]|uniref:Uncharacterized protein n=1 Tax=Acetobacter ghanensis TaxID=431306 RepID=A0A0U5F7A0_9PROT|nr:hypothetical protein [Acetobacter ghanensis]NHO38481.1 hypothetical protein [Acetobacter ghanensis]GBQ46802.1 hypothetical protein AA18895_0874 [Acetobacter ghanensis DSM 18895]CEF55342.1 hypothetical protein predicted by Glimmer/Critica [Acetobacter ghanensis]